MIALGQDDSSLELMNKKWSDLVRISRQLWARRLWIKSYSYGVVSMNALERIWILLVTPLARLLHHGVAIFIGLEDGKPPRGFAAAQ